MTAVTYSEAVNLAIQHGLRGDRRVTYFAPDPPRNFVKEFGTARVHRIPTSEAAVAGAALGMAVSGYRPVVSWSCATFAYTAFDPLVNQIAKVRYLSGGQLHAPLVVRLRYFGGSSMAGQHTATTFASYGQVPGVKVVVPATPEDAYGLMRSAIRDDDPVLFFEADSLRNLSGVVTNRSVRIGEARIVRQGTKATVVAIGSMVPLVLEVADALGDDIPIAVIDARSLAPLDAATIRDSVRETGRLVLVDESTPTCSYSAELIAAVVEDESVFGELLAAPIRICSQNVTAPYSPVLEDFVRPSAERIEDAIRKVIGIERPRLGGAVDG